MSVVESIFARSNHRAVHSVHVFGQRNSGTNYVQNLIYKNCLRRGTNRAPINPAVRKALGWKHGFPMMMDAPDDVLAVVVYRNPITWLDSLARNPWHVPRPLPEPTFSQFIRTPWRAVIDDPSFGVKPGDPQWGRELMTERDPLTGKRFANPMRLRNAKNAGFATLDHRFANVLRVRYETVLANPQGFLNAVCNCYGLTRRAEFDPILYDRGTPARGVFMPKPAPLIAPSDMDFIAQELDLDIERALGYDPLDAHLQRAA